MTLKDYFTTREVERNYGEYGIEQCFIREFSQKDDLDFRLALQDVRHRCSLYSLGRIGSNALSLAAISQFFMGVAPAIPWIFLVMSELHRYRMYNDDMDNRNSFEELRRNVIKLDLKKKTAKSRI
mgnify:CR=1 FL=1